MFIALNQFFYTHFIVGTSYTILKNTQFSFFRFPVQNRSYQNRAYEHHHRIQHIWISLDTKFHLNQTILPFWTKFPQKWVFWPKIKNLIITIDLSIFAVVFILNKIWISWTFAQNRYFGPRTGQMYIKIEPSKFELV